MEEQIRTKLEKIKKAEFWKGFVYGIFLASILYSLYRLLNNLI